MQIQAYVNETEEYGATKEFPSYKKKTIIETTKGTTTHRGTQVIFYHAKDTSTHTNFSLLFRGVEENIFTSKKRET